jgi:glucose-6-phosphate isomerase
MKKKLVKLMAMVMAVVSLLPMSVFAEETAPMAEVVATNKDMVGTWVDDVNAKQPRVIEVYEKNGELMYTYYQIVPGNGNGTGIKKTYTKFEYQSGKAMLMGNWGVFDCMKQKKTDEVYISFYLDIEKGEMTDAIRGTKTFHKVDDFQYKL